MTRHRSKACRPWRSYRLLLPTMSSTMSSSGIVEGKDLTAVTKLRSQHRLCYIQIAQETYSIRSQVFRIARSPTRLRTGRKIAHRRIGCPNPHDCHPRAAKAIRRPHGMPQQPTVTYHPWRVVTSSMRMMRVSRRTIRYHTQRRRHTLQRRRHTRGCHPMRIPSHHIAHHRHRPIIILRIQSEEGVRLQGSPPDHRSPSHATSCLVTWSSKRA